MGTTCVTTCKKTGLRSGTTSWVRSASITRRWTTSTYRWPSTLWRTFLESTTDPYYDGAIIHGRPMKAHGWSPITNAQLVEEMARHIAEHAPAEADTSWLR